MEKITWLWVEINRVILSSFDELPVDTTMSVRLEDFGIDLLQEVLAFLGVSADTEIMESMIATAQQRPNKTRSHSTPAPEKWSDIEKQGFNDTAGDMMAKLGYSLDM
jgi:hypothetical protein